MSFDHDAWKGLMDATARPHPNSPHKWRGSKPDCSTGVCSSSTQWGRLGGGGFRCLWAEALLRLDSLAALAGLLAGLWIMAEGWAGADPQRLFWGVLACLCAGVALWAFEGESGDD